MAAEEVADHFGGGEHRFFEFGHGLHDLAEGQSGEEFRYLGQPLNVEFGCRLNAVTGMRWRARSRIG